MVKALIRVGWSPEQIAGRLERMNPDDPSKQVSHETIYAALYSLPKGELRKELIESLRHRNRFKTSFVFFVNNKPINVTH